MRDEGSRGDGWQALAAFLILVFPLSWYSWLLGYAEDPGNSGINPLGPLAAALLVSLAGGWRGLKAYLRAVTRIRSPWPTYAVAFLLPVLIAIASVAILVAAFGVYFPARAASERCADVVDAFLIMFLFVALGEEPGWRGWLLPRLQTRLAPWQASLAVAPVWALWHLPMLGEDLPFDQVAPFLLSLTSASIVLAWLTNRTEGGVLPAMICHATVNAAGSSFLFSFFEGPVKTSLWWVNAILWAIAAAVVLLGTRGHLGLRKASSAVTMVAEEGLEPPTRGL